MVETLRALGIRDFFSLPGAQTMGLYDELAAAPDIRLHTVLQDAIAVGAADGMARATGALAAAGIYEFAGVANSACTIYSAWMDRSPVLVVGTLTDARQSGRGWSAEIPNIAAYAQQICKLAIEVPRVDRIEESLRRAAWAALTPPRGPVYVGVPANFFIEQVSARGTTAMALPRLAAVAPPPDDDAMRRIAEMILAEDDVAVVAGADVADAGAIDLLETLAADFALPVYIEPYSARMPIGSAHPLNFRAFTPSAPTYRSAKVVLAIGARLAKRFAFRDFDHVLAHQRLAHVHADPAEIGRVYPTEIGVVSDARGALTALRAALDALADARALSRVQARNERLAAAKSAFDAARTKARAGREHEEPADAAAVLHQLGLALRPDDVVVDELIGLRHWLPDYVDLPRADRYFGTSAGFMGWGPPAATGVALGMRASGGKGKAVLLAGDGCFVMTPQAMWTAAKSGAPVVFVVINNRGWVCVKMYYDVVRAETGRDAAGDRIGCDFDTPAIDYVALARGFGIPACTVRSAATARAALEEALRADGPSLIDIETAPHATLHTKPKP